MIQQLLRSIFIACLILAVSKTKTLTTALQPPEPSESFANRLVLVEPNQYILYWNHKDNDITFEIHVKNTTWAAFGITPNGGMAGSDVIVTFNEPMPDGSVKNHFSDRHIPKNTMFPTKDTVQNWFQLYSSNKNGYLVSKFTREIKLCQEGQQEEDLDIVDGTPLVIFAWGNQLRGGDVTYHNQNRGTKSVPLISSLNADIKINMDEVEIFDMFVNATISNTYHTEYYCEVFKVPNSWLRKKRHLIRYDTVVIPGNENLVHHWVLSECNQDFENVYLKENPLPKPGLCAALHDSQKSESYDKAYRYCQTASLVWAVGSDYEQYFPKDMAYPMGGPEGDFTYMILQMHYDNPELLSGLTDQSGIRLYTTENYRPIEFGVFSVGSTETWESLTVPPKADRFPIDYYCRNECLDKFTDTEKGNEVKIFSVLPHAHLKGTEIYTSVIRDGVEVDYLVNNKYFDFNYQYYNFLRKPITLRKGDQLKTTCVYSSPNDKDFVFGGPATTNEMCASFVWYYPRQKDFAGCVETFHKEDWRGFLKDLEKSGDLRINSAIKDEDMFPNINYIGSKKLQSAFKDFMDSKDRIEVCVFKSNATITLNNKPIKSKLMKDSFCSKKNSNE